MNSSEITIENACQVESYNISNTIINETMLAPGIKELEFKIIYEDRYCQMANVSLFLTDQDGTIV